MTTRIERSVVCLVLFTGWIAAWYFGIYSPSVNVWPQVVVGTMLWAAFPWCVVWLFRGRPLSARRD